MKHNRGLPHRLRRIERQIGEQHDRLREFHRLLHRAIADRRPADARETFGAYQMAVEAHFDLEERMLFPSLSSLDPRNGTRIGRLCVAHERFRAELDTLRDDLDASIDLFARRFESYEALIAVHERQEEALVASLARAPVA